MILHVSILPVYRSWLRSFWIKHPYLEHFSVYTRRGVKSICSNNPFRSKPMAPTPQTQPDIWKSLKNSFKKAPTWERNTHVAFRFLIAMGSGSSVPAFQLTTEEAKCTVKRTYDISEAWVSRISSCKNRTPHLFDMRHDSPIVCQHQIFGYIWRYLEIFGHLQSFCNLWSPRIMFASDSYKPKRTDGLPKLPRLWNHSSSTRKYSHEEIQKYSKAYDVVLQFGKNLYILRLGPWTVYAIKPLWWHFRRKIISFSAVGVPRVMDAFRGKKLYPGSQITKPTTDMFRMTMKRKPQWY